MTIRASLWKINSDIFLPLTKSGFSYPTKEKGQLLGRQPVALARGAFSQEEGTKVQQNQNGVIIE